MAEALFDPRPLLAALSGSSLEIVVIGGMAIIARGIIRQTADLDICYAPTRETTAGLAEALAPFRPRPRTEATEEGALIARFFRWDAQAVPQGSNLTLDTDIGPVDLLAHVPGLGDFGDALRASSGDPRSAWADSGEVGCGPSERPGGAP